MPENIKGSFPLDMGGRNPSALFLFYYLSFLFSIYFVPVLRFLFVESLSMHIYLFNTPILSMAVLIIKNCTREGPGTLGPILQSNGIEYEIFEIEHAKVISDPTVYEALLVLGGPASANDTTKAMQHEVAVIEQAVRAEVPYLGICLGMQALVKACGGRVIRNPVKEIGWKDLQGTGFSVELTPAGQKDIIFEGLEPILPIFHLHGETVELTDEMQLLATGKHCLNQVIKVGNNAYGFQGHLELTKAMLHTWLAEDDDLRQLPAEDIKRDHAAVKAKYEHNSEKVFTNFLKIAGIL